MGIPGGWELMLILAVLVLLFGASKLPNAARSIGQSMRIFKAETKGMRSEDKTADSAQHQGTQNQGTQHQGTPPAQPDGNQALPPAGPQVAPPLEHRQGHSDSTR
jgi:sec-independent protein translocase protein TatA